MEVLLGGLLIQDKVLVKRIMENSKHANATKLVGTNSMYMPIHNIDQYTNHTI